MEVEKMKKLLIITILVSILLVNLAKSADSNHITSDVVSLKTTFMNQDPYPADPGSYVDLLFKVENWGTKNAENVIFELMPEYPFSLDPGVSATKELGTIGGLQTDEKAYFVKYKVRVDKDAIDDEYEIKVKSTYDNGVASFSRTFNITVSNPRTDFDVIVQDSTASSTTLAIANIGANTAYSVIVRIPEQDNFRVTGTSASIIGNLDAGDYTLVSFQITPASNEKNLTVEISYTDKVGIRRTVEREVMLDLSRATGTLGTGIETQYTQSTQRGGLSISTGSGLTYIGVGIVGIVVIVVFLKFRKKKKR
jgi:hypothetical protein